MTTDHYTNWRLTLMTRSMIRGAAVIAMLFTTSAAFAQYPPLIFDGRLTAGDGTPINPADLAFRIDYDGGQTITVDADVEPTGDGRFTAYLHPDDVAFAAAPDAEIWVTYNAGDEPPPFGPFAIGTVPSALYCYSLPAEVTDQLDAEMAARIEALRAERFAPAGPLVVRPAPNRAAGEFGSIAEALASLDGKAIRTDQRVTIHVGAGTYPTQDSIRVTHPDGDRIFIQGEGSDTVSIESVGDFPGIDVSHGKQLGGLDGITFRALGRNESAGIQASGSSYVKCGPDVHVTGFSYGILARNNAVVVAASVRVNNARTFGILAEYNATVRAGSADIHPDQLEQGGVGVGARSGGTVEVADAMIAGTSNVCIHTDSESYIDASSVDASDCGQVGLLAARSSTIRATDIHVRQTRQQGLHATQNSMIDATRADVDRTGGVSYFAQSNSTVTVTDASPADVSEYEPDPDTTSDDLGLMSRR